MKINDIHFTQAEDQFENSIGRILFRVRTLFFNALDEAVEEYGLIHTQCFALSMLYFGKADTAAMLSKELCIDAAAIKRHIDHLEVSRLVDRHHCLDDRRQIKLHLTDSGRALAEKLPSVYEGVWRRFFKGFSNEEVGFLKNLLKRVIANHDGAPV